MSSYFQQRMARLGVRMQEKNSVPVQYTRPNVGTITIDATPLYTHQREMIPGVAVTQVHQMDWGITLTELTFDGTATVPFLDDFITTEEGLVFLVVVRSVDGRDRPMHYYYTTSLRDRVRIHTDRIG